MNIKPNIIPIKYTLQHVLDQYPTHYNEVIHHLKRRCDSLSRDLNERVEMYLANPRAIDLDPNYEIPDTLWSDENESDS